MLSLPLCRRLCCCILQLAAVLGAHASEVTNVIVFGNHASSQFPYGHLARLKGQPILQQQQQHWQQQQLGFDAAELEDYLRNEFITIVQNRGQHINRVRGMPVSPAAAC
jgi:malate dehydrogenase